MAGQVGKLILETGIKGFEEVQELGKGLKQIAKLADRTDKEFLKAAKSVKDFANSNRNSVTSIKGQIVALDKLKQSATIGGKAYKALSKDIINLNTQLLTLSNTEKVAQQAAASAALVERDASGRRMDDKRVNRGQLLSTAQLLGQVGGTNIVTGSVFERRIASFAESMKGLEVTQDKYRNLLDLLITTTRNFNNAQATATNVVSNKNAMSLVRGEIDKRTAAGQSAYSITRESPSPLAMQGPWDVGQYKREFQNKGYWEKFYKTALNAIGITSPDLQRALDDVIIPPAVPAAKKISQAAGMPFDKDPYKNILPTSASYRTEIAKLDDQLEHLTHKSEEYNTVAKQKAKLEKELAAATKETIKVERKGFRTDRRTRGRGQVYRDPSGTMIGRGQSFALPPGIESGAMQTVQSLEEFVEQQKKINITGKSNINTLTKTRTKFEEIRNTLDPTSKKFQQVTKAIAATDKALLRLSNNKFSGANLRRTGQSILGAGFVGGPAGFLGAGIGAGVEALRPGGDMAGGAITGGLVASQVLTPISQAISGSTEYAASYSKAQLTLQQITKDSGSYGVAMEAVKKAVEEFNVPQEVAIQGMTRLSAAVLGSGGNINNAAEAFLNTTAAIKGTAGSADDVKSAITAMVQIYSKGKVSAEELSGQLGERFPGAVVKFAEANDISAESLQKNLKDGTVGLDMLSKFITSLGDEYIPLAKKIAESNDEAGARARVAMNKLRIAVGDNLKDVGAEFQIIGANLLIDIIPALQTIADIGATAFGALAAVVKLVADNFNILAPAIVGTTVALTLYNIQMQIANKSGIVAMLRNVVAWMIKLRRALVLATIAQEGFNLSTLKNKWILVAAAITTAVTAIWNWRRAVAAQETGKSILGDITGYDLKETEKILAEAKGKVKEIQDLINNPATPSGQKKTLDEDLERWQNAIAELETRITKLGGKVIFDSWKKDKDKENSPFAKFTEELEKFEEGLERVTVNGFKKLEETIFQFVTTGKLAFKDLVTSVLHELTRLAIQQTVTKPLFGLFKKALGIGLNAAVPAAIPEYVDPLSDDFAKFYPAQSAKGNTFARNGIVPYAKGGVIRKPTLSLMGEQGAEAILPLQRGRGGRLGVAMQGGGGGTTNVNYTGPTLNFNGDEYLPKSAVGDIISAAAARGESKTISSLKNSRGRRASLGL